MHAWVVKLSYKGRAGMRQQVALVGCIALDAVCHFSVDGTLHVIDVCLVGMYGCCHVQVSFRSLLDEFFKRHDPTALNRQGNDVGTQYRGECTLGTGGRGGSAGGDDRGDAWDGVQHHDPAALNRQGNDVGTQYPGEQGDTLSCASWFELQGPARNKYLQQG